MNLTVSPDSRTILYTQLDETGSDLMLVENFRLRLVGDGLSQRWKAPMPRLPIR